MATRQVVTWEREIAWESLKNKSKTQTTTKTTNRAKNPKVPNEPYIGSDQHLKERDKSKGQSHAFLNQNWGRRTEGTGSQGGSLLLQWGQGVGLLARSLTLSARETLTYWVVWFVSLYPRPQVSSILLTKTNSLLFKGSQCNIPFFEP